MLEGKMTKYEEVYSYTNTSSATKNTMSMYNLDDDGYPITMGYSSSQYTALWEDINAEVDLAKRFGFTPGTKVHRVRKSGEVVTDIEGVILGYAGTLQKAVRMDGGISCINVQWQEKVINPWTEHCCLKELTKVDVGDSCAC